jgi:hypothetical protein
MRYTYPTEAERAECRRERARMAQAVAEGRLVLSDGPISDEQWAELVQMLEAAGFPAAESTCMNQHAP